MKSWALLGRDRRVGRLHVLRELGFRVASTVNAPFEKLLAAGLTALLGFQAFIIIGGVLRVLPLTGVTLPYVPTAARR